MATEITDPIILDSTGREIVSQLMSIRNVLAKGRPTIYAFHIDGNEGAPDANIEYLLDAVGMSPAYMDFANDRFVWGSWKDAFFMPRPVMLSSSGQVVEELNPDDLTKKTDGTASSISDTSFDGNAMMEFPKIWLKCVPDSGDDSSATIYLSDMQVDAKYNDFAYISTSGVHRQHFYMPIYNGSLDSGGKLRSLSGQKLMQSKTAQQECDAAALNGTGWTTETNSRIMVVNFLLMLISKSTDSNTAFGYGINTGSQTAADNYTTGSLNTKGLFYGKTDGTTAVKVFGTENWWGLQWRRYLGDILLNGKQMVKLCPSTEDGSTVSGYNLTGNGYIHVSNADTKEGTSGGYINVMKFSEYGMYSKTSSGSQTTFYTDGQWFNNGVTSVPLRGGGSDHGRRCGALCVARNGVAGDARWDIAAAPSYA